MSWAAVAGAAISVVGSSMASDAAGSASGGQSEAAYANMAMQRQQANQAANATAPYTSLGRSATGRLSQLLGLGSNGVDNRILPSGKTVDQEAAALYQTWLDRDNPGGNVGINDDSPELVQRHIENARGQILQQYGLQQQGEAADSGDLLRKFTQADMEADPVYNSGLEFGRKTGEDAINARAISGGGYDSGATLKALTRFGNDYGSTKANDSYNRFTNDQNNIYSKLSGQQSIGLNAAGQQIAAGQNATNQMAESNSQAANARAAGIVGGANAWGGATNGITSAANNYQSNSILQKLLKGGMSGAGGGTTGFYNNSPIDPYSYSSNYG